MTETENQATETPDIEAQEAEARELREQQEFAAVVAETEAAMRAFLRQHYLNAARISVRAIGPTTLEVSQRGHRAKLAAFADKDRRDLASMALDTLANRARSAA